MVGIMAPKMLALVLLVGTLFVFPAQAQKAPTPRTKCVYNTTSGYDNRLPSNVVPHEYHLLLTTYDAQSFSAKVRINIEVQKPTYCIFLNAMEINVTRAIYSSRAGIFWEQKVWYDHDKEFVIIEFNDELPVGHANLIVSYDGYVNDAETSGYGGFFRATDDFAVAPSARRGGSFRGFSHSKSKGNSVTKSFGTRHRIQRSLNKAVRKSVASVSKRNAKHLQAAPDQAGTYYAAIATPNNLRFFVPSFDEPAYTAKWQAFFVVPANSTVVFVTEPLTETDSCSEILLDDFAVPETHELVKFAQTTFAIAPHQVSWFISKLATYETTTSRGLPIRVHSHFAPFALHWGTSVVSHIVSWFETQFGVQYPAEKLDVIVVSFDLVSQGLGVLFLTPEIFIDPTLYGVPDEVLPLINQTLVYAVAEGISQTFVRALIPAQWWNQAIINEGITTYYTYLARQAYDWDPFAYDAMPFSWSELTSGMRAAEVEGFVYPFWHQPVDGETLDDLAAQVGSGSYSGAALLRNIHTLLGDAAFRSAIRNFFVRNAYTTPTVFEFLKAFETVQSGSRKHLLPWFFQTGIPYVSVKFDSLNKKVEVAQGGSNRHLPHGKRTLAFDLFYGSGSSIQHVAVVTNSSAIVNFPGARYEWLISAHNNPMPALYDYDDTTWGRHLAAVSSPAANPTSRINVVLNALLNARTAHRDARIAVDAIHACVLAGVNSTTGDYILWSAVVPVLRSINGALISAKGYNHIRQHIAQLVNTQLHHLEILNNGVDFNSPALNDFSDLLHIAVRAGDNETVHSFLSADYAALFEEDQYLAALAHGMYGGEAGNATLWAMLMANPDENIIAGIAAVPDLTTFHSLLALTGPSLGTLIAIHSAIENNPVVRIYAVEVIRHEAANWISAGVAESTDFEDMFEFFSTPYELKVATEVIEAHPHFFSAYQADQILASIKQNIDVVRINRAFLRGEYDNTHYPTFF